jgi:acetyl/propionyl-CoA carboxylase alpha subunit
MTLEIEINGRSHTVAIDRGSAGRYHVAIDGQPHVVDAVRVGEFALSLIVDSDSGTSREIYVVPGATRGQLLIGLDGRTVAVTVNGRRRGHAVADAGVQSRGEQRVTAPMPGRVVRVLVGAGDEVIARQPVVVVEAMKMENELQAPKTGRVKEVTVSAGASVEAGKVLVVVE